MYWYFSVTYVVVPYQLLCLFAAVGARVAAGQEAVPTVAKGATYQLGNTYAGLYAAEGRPDGGAVTISSGAGGQDMSLADIIGNWNEADDERAYWGTVTMTGGEVHDLYGEWCPLGNAGHSTVISAEHIDKENIRNFHLTAAGFSMQVQTIAAGPA